MDGSITDDQAHEWLQEIADNGWISLHFDNTALGGSDLAEICTERPNERPARALLSRGRAYDSPQRSRTSDRRIPGTSDGSRSW